MKKNLDLTKPVMEKVVRFERRHIWIWVSRFVTILGILVAAAFAFLLFATKEIIERDTFSLLTLFGEDKEIIQEFWQDTLSIFWEELPHRKLALGIGFLITIVVLVVVNRKKITLMIKKVKTIVKYTKKV